MDRVIFCPDESCIESAELLARSWALPVQIGHSARTSSIDFDETKVSVLTIPVDNFVDYLSPIAVNELFVFTYVDDFNSCKNVSFVLAEVDDDGFISRIIGDMNPHIVEEHRAIIKHRFPREGRYLIRVQRDTDEVCQNEVFVWNPQRR